MLYLQKDLAKKDNSLKQVVFSLIYCQNYSIYKLSLRNKLTTCLQKDNIIVSK